jgi:hypothetical protein
MALMNEALLRAAASEVTRRFAKTANKMLEEATTTYKTSFDVFLSHSRLDSEIVLGAKVVIEATGRSVYVDWIEDPGLDRGSVSPKTAETLRTRMKQSTSLFYAHSGNSTKSRWMPWELGYFDGFNGNVAVLPIVQSSGQGDYKGEEYLGLYPYVDLTGKTDSSPGTIYIHRNVKEYLNFDRWQKSSDKYRPL